MSRILAKSCAIYLDEYDLTGISNAADIDIDDRVADVTAFADTDTTWVEGKPLFIVRVNGFYSTTSPDWDVISWTNLTTANKRLGIYPGGRTEGNRGYELITMITESPRMADYGRAIAINVTWQGDLNAAARSQLLDIDTAVGASGNGTAYDTAAVLVTQQAVGVLRLLAAPAGAGNNTLDVIIQSDDNQAFTSPTTRLTFTQLTQASVALSEVQTAAGAITDGWWRVNYTYAGVGSRTFSLVIALGTRRV